MKVNWTTQIAVPVVIAFATSSAAQTPQSANENSRVRIEYSGAGTPDHIAFQVVSRHLTRLNGKSREKAVEWVRYNMDYATLDVAESFLNGLLGAHESIEAEKHELKLEMLCGQGRSNDSRILYRKMDALDDAKAAVAQKHYLIFISNLDQDTTARFGKWLETSKSGIRHVRSKHDGMFDGSGVDPAAYVDQLCVSWAGMGTNRMSR